MPEPTGVCRSLALSAVLILTICLPRFSAAQETYALRGVVRGPEGAPMRYARVLAPQQNTGALTGPDGVYEMRLPPGRHVVECRYVGFAPVKKTVALESDATLDFQLQQHALQTEDVYVTADGRDPAYGFVRKAIDARKRNRDRLPRYTYDAYTRVRIELLELPKLLTGSMPDTTNRILYLAENLSEVAFEAPDRVSETITASKVSGDSEAYSFFGSIFARFSVYENLTDMEGLSDRGYVSPVADNAFFFYDYRLAGARLQEGRKLYRVELAPRRENDPAFEGWIEIADSTWEIAAFELVADQKRPLENFTDSVAIGQRGLLAGGVWKPAEVRFDFQGGGLGARFGGYALTALSNYDPVQTFAPNTFGSEVLRITDTAAARPDSFWQARRPVQLDSLERRDYAVKDSLETVRSSPEYLDSLTRRSFVPGVGNVFSPWRMRNYRRDWSLTLSPLAENVFYNTIEGGVLNLDAALALPPRETGRPIVEAGARYATGRREFRWRGAFVWREGGGRRGRFRYNRNEYRVGGGAYVSEISPRVRQIAVPVNGFYALFTEQNFLKLYHKNYVELSGRRQLANGLRGSLRFDFEDRRALANAADRSWFPREAREFSPNLQFPAHQALLAAAEITWLPGNRYISTPDGRFSLGSKWPELSAAWRGGFAAGGAPGSRFQFVRARAGKTLALGLLGSLTARAGFGRFIQAETLHLPDYYHVKANQTLLADRRGNEFNLMRYYEYSTNTEFAEIHLTHRFNGFIMRKLPALRRLDWQWTLGADVLHTPERGLFAEAEVGLEQVFGAGVVRAHVLGHGDGWARAAFSLGWGGF